jgi:hypothetical protein
MISFEIRTLNCMKWKILYNYYDIMQDDLIYSDIKFIKWEIKENSSIPYDTKNVAYKWFKAVDKIIPLMIKSKYSHLDIIKYYIGGFRDSHFRFLYNRTFITWAGIIVTFTNGSFIIVYARDNSIIGLPITHVVRNKKKYTCNKFLLKYIFPFESCGGIPYHEYNYAIHANDMFTNKQSDAIVVNKQVYELLYESINYNNYELALSIDPNRNRFINNKFAINDIFQECAWINLPSFTSDFSKINDRIENYRKYKLLIIDIRGNGGGNNNYGIEFVRKLWSPEYIHSLNDFGNTGDVLFRISETNAARYPNLGIRKYDLENNLSYALFRTYKHDTIGNHVPNPVTAMVYCLIDYFTGSSSLLFLDEILSLPNVYTIGLPTSNDTIFGDGSFSIELPSGIGKITSIPKIRVGKWKRLHGECYKPNYKLDVMVSDADILSFIEIYIPIWMGINKMDRHRN